VPERSAIAAKKSRRSGIVGPEAEMFGDFNKNKQHYSRFGGEFWLCQGDAFFVIYSMYNFFAYSPLWSYTQFIKRAFNSIANSSYIACHLAQSQRGKQNQGAQRGCMK